MPSPRRQRIVSPSISIDSRVVNGTPSWITTDAADGEAVLKPMNSRAKFPAPISSATTTIRHVGLGAGSSHGRVAKATSEKRTAA